MTEARFDLQHVLDELKHLLPSQTPIKDFIHHNSLHAYQHLPFFEAIFKASSFAGYQVTLQLSEFRELYYSGRIRKDALLKVIKNRKGIADQDIWLHHLLNTDYPLNRDPLIGRLRSQWKKIYAIDLDHHVQPLLFRILCSYLDQGITIWPFPLNGQGFIESVRNLESSSMTSLFKTSRGRNLLANKDITVQELLNILVGDEQYFTQYLFDQQFSHPGWSGIVSAIEQAPHTLMDSRAISLNELILFELILEIDALEDQIGRNWKSLGSHHLPAPIDLFADQKSTEWMEVLKLWQEAFEWSYYDEVLSGIRLAHKQSKPINKHKSFQAIFCIDERECSLRRHIEQEDQYCETLGMPGFFGVEFYFQPEHGKFYDKLCPAPVTPAYLIKESEVKEKRGHEMLYKKETNNLVFGSFATLVLGIWSGLKLGLTLFRPKMSPAISDAYAHMGRTSVLSIENSNPSHRENNLQIGFTVLEMTDRVEAVLRNIGLIEQYAPLIYFVAHGSSSANNPHHGAHDCGACSGRPGSVNARVMATMANHPEVRKSLKDRGIFIPDYTQFLGGLHDTASDQIEFYDEVILTPTNSIEHQKHLASFDRALDMNAKERSRRFASISTRKNIRSIRRSILKRSVSMFEPRPELGHGTNTLCIVGRREMTQGLFLDRRAFLNSYDYRTDPDGHLLVGVMRPLGPVCGGINLEYYFSRVDNYRLGAGTKLPHNVMGLIGVANSCDGDLRPGLPLQMIEVHDPVRLLIIVEHRPEVVLKAIQSTPEMYEWYINEWVKLVVLHPESKDYYYFEGGQFNVYEPLNVSIEKLEDMNTFLESAPEMETNYIVDATKEHLPVSILNS
ncbi:MAG: DUF2309 domain-containing protein [Chitinophagaceae bacterium]|nr:DUF2309 domain-containing protein [Chitinophagaceae bacterium]